MTENTPTTDAQTAQTDERGLDVDHRSDAGRDACKYPDYRCHEDYRMPRWATCHIDDVDNLFVAGPLDEDDDKVRIDLDGLGDGRASLHDTDINLNLSVWLTLEQVDELVKQLVTERPLRDDADDERGDA